MSESSVSDEARRAVSERAPGRAHPLPEEQVGESTEAERTAGAEAILRESEERVAGVTDADEPADAADQRRRSEETL